MKCKNVFSNFVTNLVRMPWRKQGIFVLLFGVVILIRRPLEQLIAQLGSLLFPAVHFSRSEEIVFCSFALIFLLIFLKRIFRTQNPIEAAAGILFALAYCAMRFTVDVIAFRSFRMCDLIFYSDVILLFGGIFTIEWLVWFFKNVFKSNRELNLAKDATLANDMLDRLSFVSYLIGRIEASFMNPLNDHESSHNSIGVNA